MIDPADPTLQFIPALSTTNGKQNIAKIILRRSYSDGTYYLMAKATDRSGNSSGENDYMTSFKVINKSAISNIINYPNPFTSSTRFVYTPYG